jgi:hypothetical protein
MDPTEKAFEAYKKLVAGGQTLDTAATFYPAMKEHPDCGQGFGVEDVRKLYFWLRERGEIKASEGETQALYPKAA